MAARISRVDSTDGWPKGKRERRLGSIRRRCPLDSSRCCVSCAVRMETSRQRVWLDYKTMITAFARRRHLPLWFEQWCDTFSFLARSWSSQSLVRSASHRVFLKNAVETKWPRPCLDRSRAGSVGSCRSLGALYGIGRRRYNTIWVESQHRSDRSLGLDRSSLNQFDSLSLVLFLLTRAAGWSVSSPDASSDSQAVNNNCVSSMISCVMRGWCAINNDWHLASMCSMNSISVLPGLSLTERQEESEEFERDEVVQGDGIQVTWASVDPL